MGNERRLLRVLRAQHEPKVSQMQAARKAGMGTFRYWQIENGEGPPASSDEREAVAAAFDVKASEIAWPELEKAQAS